MIKRVSKIPILYSRNWSPLKWEVINVQINLLMTNSVNEKQHITKARSKKFFSPFSPT